MITKISLKARFVVIITYLLVAVACLVVGFAVTSDVVIGWDDGAQMAQSGDQLRFFGLVDRGSKVAHHYAPLWELSLGIMTEFAFPKLKDPFWVRHAFTYGLFLFSLFLLFRLIKRAGHDSGTAVLCAAIVFSIIRLGGHSLFNTKDAPAAIGYLLVTVYLWVLLKEAQEKHYPIRKLLLVGLVAIIPFLLRVPLLLHFCLLFPILLFICLFGRRISLLKRLSIFMIPILTGLFLLWLMYPPIRELGFDRGYDNIKYFSNFGYRGIIRVFGQTFSSTNPPWWYSFAWIPVIIHPLSLVLVVFGIASSFVFHPNQKAFSLPILFWKIKFSLSHWVLAVSAISFTIVVYLDPSLYGAERHILFLYPILFLCGGLGLFFLQKNTKYILASIIFLTSILMYMQWGVYSYIYISPVIRNRSIERFSGDHQIICASRAVKYAEEFYSKDKGPLYLHGFIIHVAKQQRRRLEEGVMLKSPVDVWVENSSKKRPTYLLVPNTVAMGEWDWFMKNDSEFKEGISKIVWEDKLPTGSLACAVLFKDK